MKTWVYAMAERAEIPLNFVSSDFENKANAVTVFILVGVVFLALALQEVTLHVCTCTLCQGLKHKQ